MRDSKINVRQTLLPPTPEPAKPVFADLPEGSYFYWMARGSYLGTKELNKKIDCDSYVSLEKDFYEGNTCQHHWYIQQVDLVIHYTEVDQDATR